VQWRLNQWRIIWRLINVVAAMYRRLSAADSHLGNETGIGIIGNRGGG